MSLSPILLLRLGLMNKFSNPAFHHLIKPMDLFLKTGILTFSEKHLLITG
jgi:hypothetical protein